MSRKFRVEGFKELQANLSRMKQATARAQVRRAAREALEPLARDMRAQAPRDEGQLIESIDVSQTAKPPLPKRDPFEIAVGPGRMPQAITQEFGTFKEPAQPYVRPVYEAGKNGVIDRFGVFLAQSVMRSIKRVRSRGR